MARPNKLLRQYEELKKKQASLMQSGQLMQGMQLQAKIDAIKQELQDIEQREIDRKLREKTTLRELLPKDEVVRNNIHKLLVKVSLASDYLYDCVFELTETLAKLDILVDSLSEEAKAVCKASNALASKLITDKAPQLASVLLDDEYLVDKLHEVMNHYVDKTLEL